MRDMKTVIASWLAGLFAIGFALFSLWLPLYSRSESMSKRVTVTVRRSSAVCLACSAGEKLKQVKEND